MSHLIKQRYFFGAPCINLNKYCLIIFNPLGTEHPCPSKKKKQSNHSMRKSQNECEREVKSRLIRNLGSPKRGLIIFSLNPPSLRKHKDEIEVLMMENKIDILALNVLYCFVLYCIVLYCFGNYPVYIY